MNNRLIEICAEFPVCRIRHGQSFAWEELYALLQDNESVRLFDCPRSDASWQPSLEHRERLTHSVPVFARLYNYVRQSHTEPGGIVSAPK
jgi:hypothetical protein